MTIILVHSQTTKPKGKHNIGNLKKVKRVNFHQVIEKLIY